MTDEPQTIRSSSIGSNSFKLSWSAPANASCQLIQGYRVQCQKIREMSAMYSINVSSFGPLTVLVEGLVPYTEYSCCVTALNYKGGQERGRCHSSIRTLGGILHGLGLGLLHTFGALMLLLL